MFSIHVHDSSIPTLCRTGPRIEVRSQVSDARHIRRATSPKRGLRCHAGRSRFPGDEVLENDKGRSARWTARGCAGLPRRFRRGCSNPIPGPKVAEVERRLLKRNRHFRKCLRSIVLMEGTRHEPCRTCCTFGAAQLCDAPGGKESRGHGFNARTTSGIAQRPRVLHGTSSFFIVLVFSSAAPKSALRPLCHRPNRRSTKASFPVSRRCVQSDARHETAPD